LPASRQPPINRRPLDAHQHATALRSYSSQPHRQREDGETLQAHFGKQDYSEADDDDVDDVIDLDAIDANTGEQHFAMQIAHLLIRSGKFPDQAQALDFLLSTQHGAALLQRLRASKRATTNKGAQQMTDPDFEVVTIAKAFADTGRAFWSEHQLTQKIFDYAQLDKRENETPHQAFARHFESNETFRKAIAVAKVVGLTPVEIEGRQVGDQDAVDVADPAEALRQIEAIIARVRARSPDLTQSAAWQKVLAEHPKLARAAIKRPEVNKAMAYPFPR